MDCFTEFFCENADETVHFSFDYFKTEKDFDRLQIKSPGEFRKYMFLCRFFRVTKSPTPNSNVYAV